ncbi:MAG: dihydroneopterin aldolase [Actinobacteria bacterium]|nr:dihydroneopterin aldolase [Actinomycetota bacterium]
MEYLDKITVTGIRAFGYHGVYDDERRNGQEFIVDVVLLLDTRAAAASDEVTDTVHYGEVAEQIVRIVEGEPVNLLEKLAARIADDMLALPAVRTVIVTVHKPAAPIPVPFGDVSVTIRRNAPVAVEKAP